MQHLSTRPFFPFTRATLAIHGFIFNSFPCLLHLQVEAFLRTDNVAVVTWHDRILGFPLKLVVKTSNTHEVLAFTDCCLPNLVHPDTACERREWLAHLHAVVVIRTYAARQLHTEKQLLR